MHNGIQFSNKEEWNIVICSKMDKIGGHHIKLNKLGTERQILYSNPHMWELKQK